MRGNKLRISIIVLGVVLGAAVVGEGLLRPDTTAYQRAASSESAAASPSAGASQSTVASQSAATSITEEEIREHIFYLASDELRGRDTGDEGYIVAARYSVQQMMESGVLPVFSDRSGMDGYLQSLPMSRVSFGPENSATLNDAAGMTSLSFGSDYFVVSNSTAEREEVTGRLVFAGYGIVDPAREWDDLEGLDLTGGIVVAMMGIPPEEITPAFAGESVRNPWAPFRGRIAALEARGVAGVIVVFDPQSMSRFEMMASYLSRPQVSVGDAAPRSQFPDATVPVVFLGPDVLGELFAGRGFDPVSLEGTYSTSPMDDVSLTLVTHLRHESVSAPNVVGLVEGSDPALRDEYVVLGAHLDHLGVQDGEVFNGADDNASGSVGVLEVAEAMVMDPPRRSVLFALWAGEERGLLGSRHFVEDPPVPLEQIVANVNIEMIGRWSHRPEGAIFAILGTDDDGALRDALTRVNEAGFGYELEAPERFFGGSDHMAFQSVGIPNITIAGSPPYDTHDDYHREGDEAEKIEIPKMRKAAALIYELTREIANRGG